MLLLPNASLLYLTSGIENPTPHDYPLLTAIRRQGQLETIEQLAKRSPAPRLPRQLRRRPRDAPGRARGLRSERAAPVVDAGTIERSSGRRT